MNNKGFTLIEVLTVVAIVSLLTTIAITSVSSVLKSGNDKYYKNQENMILMAAKEYYLDHKNELPLIEDEPSEVTIKELEDGDYIDNVKSGKGNSCNKESKVTVYKTKNGKYKYTVKLLCPDTVT